MVVNFFTGWEIFFKSDLRNETKLKNVLSRKKYKVICLKSIKKLIKNLGVGPMSRLVKAQYEKSILEGVIAWWSGSRQGIFRILCLIHRTQSKLSNRLESKLLELTKVCALRGHWLPLIGHSSRGRIFSQSRSPIHSIPSFRAERNYEKFLR